MSANAKSLKWLAGADVMIFKIFSPKNGEKNWRFFTQNTV
jgi:hypothetical protein